MKTNPVERVTEEIRVMDEQNCCFKGCVRKGVPRHGFDFFSCEECCIELEQRIRAMMTPKEYEAFESYWEKRAEADHVE
jgi:hypothetical protein